MEKAYLEVIGLIERLHRQFLEVVKAELDRLGIQDINNVQALILYNVSEEEVTVGELTYRGYYLGSNVSYNLKRMVEAGYLEQERSTHDRRTVRVRLSEKGRQLRDKIAAMYQRHAADLTKTAGSEGKITAANEALWSLGRFWNEILNSPARIVRPEGKLSA
ncbi:MAG: winged helix DNA-binding protein [Alphaproteobacteria bacterium]